MTLFAYPEGARFGRVIPKTKIYEHAQPTPALKQRFVRQVEQIVWQYKLAPQTVNLPATSQVTEIQVFVLTLKSGELSADVLRAIDTAIPFPIVFELHYDGAIQVWAAYKAPHPSTPERWHVGEYFWSQWLSVHDARSALPIAIDMEQLYGRIVAPLLPYPARPGERLAQHISRLESITRTQTALHQLERRVSREQQFNRKLALHDELRRLTADLRHLTA
jgi:hypothetical protein